MLPIDGDLQIAMFVLDRLCSHRLLDILILVLRGVLLFDCLHMRCMPQVFHFYL